jgi:hypothetical protein
VPEIHLSELAHVGITGMNQILRDRLARLEQRSRKAELIWIAEILLDLIQAYEQYQQHDAQFDAEQVVNWLGELHIRSDAIRNQHLVDHPVPSLFIRGMQQCDRLASPSPPIFKMSILVPSSRCHVTSQILRPILLLKIYGNSLSTPWERGCN